jgi:lipopolysaccharide export system protein LptA
MRATTIAALIGVIAAGAAWGADSGLSDPNAPIEVSADRSDADQNTDTLIYSGNVVVRQGDVRLRANTVRILAAGGKRPNQVDRIYASGHVVVDAPSGTATGDNGVYDVRPRIITLTGRVVLTRNQDVMRGDKLIVDLISGVAKLGGEQQGGRIQGMFTPKADADEKK